MEPPATYGEPDEDLERALRPKVLDDFTGQAAVVRNLRIAIRAAQARHEPLDHVLFSGPPGLGKTTLARIIANEMGAEFKDTAGPLLEKPGDLAGILSALLPGSVLFIDEVHNCRRVIEEYLYSAMEDFRISIQIGEGAVANAVTLNLNPFTLVAATTREGLLSAPFRARFGIRERLDLYDTKDLLAILQRGARLLGVRADEPALRLIAERSRGTPRNALNVLRRIRDLAQVEHANHIAVPVAEEGLAMLGIDAAGLTALDRRILQCLANTGRPVGLKTIAVTIGEEDRTIEDVYEPFLIQCALIAKTPQGRILLDRGYAQLGLAPPPPPSSPATDPHGQERLF